MGEEEGIEITLDDVEAAVKVINLFLRRQREAERALSRLSRWGTRGHGGYPFDFRSIISAVTEEVLARRGITPEGKPAIEEVPTPEELERLRKIGRKLKQRTRSYRVGGKGWA